MSCARLKSNGRIGVHPAAAPQLLFVMEGHGWVRGRSGHASRIEAGQAAFWETGEEHETWTDDGLVAVIVEGPGVNPSFLMPRAQRA